MTIKDIYILQEHGIKVRITQSDELEVQDIGMLNGELIVEWIKAPFCNTKALYEWLGY